MRDVLSCESAVGQEWARLLPEAGLTSAKSLQVKTPPAAPPSPSCLAYLDCAMARLMECGDSAEPEAEVLMESAEPDARAPRASTRTWAVSALLLVALVAAGLLYNVSGHPFTLRGAPEQVLGFSGDGSFTCGQMKCTPGSICCGGTECCSAGSECCGGTCLAAGGICCRNRTDTPLLCTPGTHCCGKETDTAQCCTTGCADGPFVACKFQT